MCGCMPSCCGSQLTLKRADYPSFAPAARELGTDIRTAYAEALEATEKKEKEQDHYCKFCDCSPVK